MPTNQENSSNVKDYLDIDNLQGETNGVNSTFGKVNEYLGKGSDVAAVFNSDPMIGKTLGYFSNKAAIIDAIDSGVNGGYNGFMSSVAGTFSEASAAMLVASLVPQLKGVKYLIKMSFAVYVGNEVGIFTKETFLNKEYRKLEFDPYDTQTHKFEDGNWYEKNDNGSLTLIEDTNIIDNLNQGASESNNFNFYKDSKGEVVIEPKNPAFREYYNIRTNGDIQTVTDNGLTVSTKQTDGVIRVETYSSSTEDSRNLTSLTVINPDGTYDYKNKVTGDWVKNSADGYIQTVKTSGTDGLNIKQIIIDKNTGKAVVKTFDGDHWETKEYDSSSEVNEYIKDGGKFEYVDENSSVINANDGSKIIFHKNGTTEEKYILDKDGALKSYEIKDEEGKFQKYEGDSLDSISKDEIQSISNALNDSIYSKTELENSINNLDKSNLTEPTEVGYVSLKEEQTISHIASKIDGVNSIDLLEYNGLTLEQAKNLPIGFQVKIPENIITTAGENGAIKIYEGYDDTGVVTFPNENGELEINIIGQKEIEVPIEEHTTPVLYNNYETYGNSHYKRALL